MFNNNTNNASTAGMQELLNSFDMLELECRLEVVQLNALECFDLKCNSKCEKTP